MIKNVPKVVFMGSGPFALVVFKFLLHMESIDLDLVITQPARSVGRKKLLQMTPVGKFAHSKNLKIVEAANSTQILESLDFSDVDLVVCVDYGVLLKQDVLDAPKFGIINIHPSLLPKYRGCSPLQAALRNGDAATGVVIQKMVLAMDAGPIYSQQHYDLDSADDIESLADTLANLACHDLEAVILGIVSNSLDPIEQEGAVSFCGKVKKEDGLMDPTVHCATEFVNALRAFKLWPGVTIDLDEKKLKLLTFNKVDDIELSIFEFKKINKSVYLGVKEGTLELMEVQPESKKPMTALAFYNGYLQND